MRPSKPFDSQPHVQVDWHLLWQRSQSGDRKAFATLYQSLTPRLYDYGLKIHPRPAMVEDAVQDVIVRLWQQRQTLQPKSILQYCFTALRRQLLRNLRKTRFELSVEALPAVPELPGTDTTSRKMPQLQSVINQLTSRQREVIYLRFFAQLDNDEMAQVMGIQKTAVYKLVSRALQELRTKGGI